VHKLASSLMEHALQAKAPHTLKRSASSYGLFNAGKMVRGATGIGDVLSRTEPRPSGHRLALGASADRDRLPIQHRPCTRSAV
jgi:hypothetical protein